VPAIGSTRRAVLAGAAGLASTVTLAGRRALADSGVVVGTWGGDYAEQLVLAVDRPLLKPLGIDVTQEIATEDARRAKLISEQAGRRGSVDVEFLSDMDAWAASLLGTWEPITPTNVPGASHVLPPLRINYGVPHVFTGLVIAYHPDHVQPAPTSFADFWDPQFRNRIGFTDPTAIYNIAAAALSHGGSMGNLDPGRAALRDLRKLGAKVYPSNDALADAFRTNVVWLAPMWLARIVYWRRNGVPVAPAIPSEGVIPYSTVAAVPKNATNKSNAVTYLNALLDPLAQLAFAERLDYAPTVDNAALPPEVAQLVTFPATALAKFKTPDFEYLNRNLASLTEYWQKEFRSG
jgi:putative spermidine/putrescine transport system substrate-binding protein